MDLIIKNYNNVYELRGSLFRFNVHIFHNEFQNIFDENNNLTISIVNLEKIDNYGVNAIVKLHNEALTKLKRLSIIGLGNQELFNHFEAVETSVIRQKSVVNVTETIFRKLYQLFENYKRKFILPTDNAIHI